MTNTVVTFGANGIIGVGAFINDCNSTGPCPPGSQSANYYSCPTTTTCTGYTASLAQQVQNPVALLATDNNGVILELPAVADTGATSASGSLVFGIATESNNALGTATQLLAPAALITATLNGTAYTDSYLDSGSNANYFPSSITPCSSSGVLAGFYCPTATTVENATLEDTTGTMLAADFDVADPTPLTTANPSLAAFPGLGATPLAGNTSTVDLGLGFFFGRNVYTGFETNPSGAYFAY